MFGRFKSKIIIRQGHAFPYILSLSWQGPCPWPSALLSLVPVLVVLLSAHPKEMKVLINIPLDPRCFRKLKQKLKSSRSYCCVRAFQKPSGTATLKTPKHSFPCIVLVECDPSKWSKPLLASVTHLTKTSELRSHASILLVFVKLSMAALATEKGLNRMC